MTSRNRSIPINLSVVIATLFLLTCTYKNGVIEPLYVPSITFTGNFAYGSSTAGTPETLAGTFAYPNRCYSQGDTVFMYFYSHDYALSQLSEGKLITFQLYRTDSNYIVTGDGIFHCVDYSTGQSTSSYYVTLADTNGRSFGFHMKAESFSHQAGGKIDLTEIAVNPEVLASGLSMTISKGEIHGNVQPK